MVPQNELALWDQITHTSMTQQDRKHATTCCQTVVEPWAVGSQLLKPLDPPYNRWIIRRHFPDLAEFMLQTT